MFYFYKLEFKILESVMKLTFCFEKFKNFKNEAIVDDVTVNLNLF